jgi:hypothetical protein
MFVRQSTYEKMHLRALLAEARVNIVSERHNAKVRQWNDLVARINALGGEQFLRGGERQVAAQFTADELRSLIQLCHPDKHAGKPIATEMTTKLLAMREAMQ